MKIFELFACTLFLVATISAKNYTNYKLVQLLPITLDHINLLVEWENNPDFDVWNSIRGINKNVDVLLSPEAFEKYQKLFSEFKIPFIITYNNVQDLVEQEAKQIALSRMSGKIVNTYATYNEILNWMDWIANNNYYTSTYSAGTTLQGRDLKVLKIKVGSPAKKIWFDCGIHAREWIASATCVSLIDKFVNGYNNGVPDVINILNKYELHFLPLLNPDGYVYSQTNDRYWRKNRKSNSGSTCIGVDLNRNFPFKWLSGGASTDPCSDTFAGSAAGSELETQSVINTLQANTDWAAFFTIHSYGNWFLSPWGYTTGLPTDWKDHDRVGKIFRDAVKNVYGETYDYGSTAQLLYIASGNSVDWAYGSLNIKYSYTIELRPYDGFGVAGFVLDPAQIPFVGEEIYVGLKASINAL